MKMEKIISNIPSALFPKGLAEPGQFRGDVAAKKRGRLYQCRDSGQAAIAAATGPGKLWWKYLECPEDAEAKGRQHAAIAGRNQ